MDRSSAEILYHVTLIGESNTGKTQLCRAFKQDAFKGDYQPTIGCAMENVTFYSGECGKTITVSFWDTAGTEKYNSLMKIYSRNSDLGLVVYDIANESSFNRIEYWKNQYENSLSQDNNNNPSPIIIVGNKLDLRTNDHEVNQNFVAYQQLQDFATPLGCQFHEVSAKTGENVPNLLDMIKKILVRRKIQKTENLQLRDRASSCFGNCSN